MNTEEALSIRLFAAEKRERDALGVGDWSEVYRARDEAQRLRQAITDALRPESIRGRQEVAWINGGLPDSIKRRRWEKARQALTALPTEAGEAAS